ncbi:MAG: multidrug MFS transporter [Peptococcaceae bacterium BRH_c8a]|nr:MAG: multidrug MFS transporter [Peptococcaceae bacterium BRH_c8a]
MDQAKTQLWTKDFIILAGANFFVALTFYLLMTNLAVYAVEEFNASPSKAGLASSIFIIGALVFRLFAGRYIEFIGRKKMLFGGLCLFLLAILLYFAVEDLNLLLVVRFIHGAAFGVAATAMATIVMNIIPRERLGEGTSYFSMSSTLAMAIGPFLGVFISQHAGFTMIFVACTLFSMLSVIISLFSHIPAAIINQAELEAMQGFKLKNFFEVKAVPISIIIAVMGFSFSGILTFLTSYTKEIVLIDAASFFFIVYAAFILISRPFTGRLLDLKGANLVIYPSLIIFMLGLVLLSQVQHSFTLLLAGAVIGLGFGTIISCSQAIAVRESPKYRVGLAISTFFICLDGGVGIGPFLLGYIIPILGFRGLYAALAVVVLACIFLYYLLHGKKEAYRKRYSITAS